MIFKIKLLSNVIPNKVTVSVAFIVIPLHFNDNSLLSIFGPKNISWNFAGFATSRFESNQKDHVTEVLLEFVNNFCNSFVTCRKRVIIGKITDVEYSYKQNQIINKNIK